MSTETREKVRLDKFDSSIGLDRGASKIKEVCWYLIKVCFFLTPLPFPSKFKVILLKSFGAKVGKGVVIKPRVNIHFPWKLKVGNHVWIGEEVFLLNFEALEIGNNVCISQRSFLCGGNHDYRDPSMPYRNGPISINDGSWVGANCFVGPNVSIGKNTVVTVGSVIVADLDDDLIVSRPPQERVKSRWKH